MENKLEDSFACDVGGGFHWYLFGLSLPYYSNYCKLFISYEDNYRVLRFDCGSVVWLEWMAHVNQAFSDNLVDSFSRVATNRFIKL